MNKVFKVIWSEARNAYVVVSEMAKSHGTKSCSTKKLLAMLIATGVMTCASVAPAMAANLAPDDTKIEVGKDAKAKGTDGVAIGKGSEDSAAGWATAIGGDAKATGAYSVALGKDAKSTELQSIAIGNESASSGGSSIAVGTRAKASGGTSIAISQDANASGESSMAFGISSTASDRHTIAIGSIAKALATNAIAIGSQTIADKDNSVAVGPNIQHIGTGAAAVGAQANATGDYSVAMGNLVNVDADWNKNHPGESRKSGSFSVALGSQSGAWGAVSTAVGALSKAEGEQAIAVGYMSQANVANGTAVGGFSKAEGEYATVLGYAGKASGYCSTALGDFAEANVSKGVALGASSVADRESHVVGLYAPDEDKDSLTWKANAGAVSVGSATITRQITNVAAGSADTDAVNVAQLNAVKAAAGKKVSLVDGENTKATLVKDDATGTQYKVDVDLSKYAKTEDVAVVYDKNKTSLRSTNATLQTSSKEEEAVDSIALGKDASAVKESVAIGNGASVVEGSNGLGGVALGYKAHAGYKGTSLGSNAISGREGTTLVGANTNSGSLYTTVVGTDSVINSDGTSYEAFGRSINVQGATATVVGSKNTVDNKNGKVYSGVANNVMGSANTVEGSNGVTIQGTGEYVDFSGDKNISVSHDGTKVQVELNKNIDVNSIKTNALNSKYNLSVGTMAENGIMPFLVSSTGAFYAANNNFSVDKDGKVIATAGKIGNVVLKNGVYTGNSALRDGELYLGDASGNYSQITPKSAKLGQVTIDEKGNMAGVNSIKTNALNAKYNLSVGTMAENGIMPFLVSSTGAFYAANNNFSVDKDGKVIATAGKIGNVVLKNGVYTGNSALRDGELYLGDASGNYSQITTTGAKLGQVTIAADGKISGVAAGEVSSTSTDAINGSQLYQTNENVAQNKADIAQNKADIAQNKADIAQNKADIAQNKADIAQNKADIAQNKADIAQNKADIAQNKADIAQNKADIATNKADIATNKANIAQNAADIKNVEALAKKHTTVAAGDNITVSDVGPNAEGGKEYKVALNNDITVQSVKAGDTTISDKGLEIKDGPSVTKDGINAGNKKVTGVADGDVKENSKDAINGGQLHQAKADINNRIDGVENQVVSNTNRINQLGNRVNKVGAGAAALAALHPMDFDPDDKLTFSAGYGNYGGENAAAIGAYYRPDEKVMFSVAGTVGNGENMVNAGVSFALDRTNHVSNSRTALAREVIDLRGQLAVMGAKMAKMEKAFGMLDETKTKLFPDVPANHWAYEYIAKLAGNGYIEGYPDGNFGGDRLMTRYEFAAMLYRAIEKGAALEEKIIKEFEPELGRIRVDRISGEDGDRDKIERVRVNNTKGERDHYGNKLAK
ncbi:ESPR-type extended signal peptide-containing protein [Phascolarctobacterium succinatutens]|uniref:ESPR-type extended signal peptide-containing protein n=1 Tax=Phascolarctobacterium succinatutens TaxID=626940 RepID=UPI0026653C2E|nr:ESPR-type extended signal peptide-containing protein [Phascolarctobacterium succinatutens]